MDNTAGPVDVKVSVTGLRPVGGGTDYELNETGRVLVPKAIETFTYDDDGNMTSDSLWTYVWDGENRLKEAISQLPDGSESYKKVTFRYDYANRMARKEVWKWDGAWVSEYRRYYVWQGWNIIGELEEKKPTAGDYTGTATLLRRNIWGLDLSGSLQGAGGVGGLLAVQNLGGPTPLRTTPAYDGNGNILAYHELTTGLKVADFAYGPFGEPLKAYGPAAAAHPIRFSTKPVEEVTGLVLYQLRPYRADLGRWLQRDRIWERGGVNLYGMVGNSPINFFDILGNKPIASQPPAEVIRNPDEGEPFTDTVNFAPTASGVDRIEDSDINVYLSAKWEITTCKTGKVNQGSEELYLRGPAFHGVRIELAKDGAFRGVPPNKGGQPFPDVQAAERGNETASEWVDRFCSAGSKGFVEILVTFSMFKDEDTDYKSWVRRNGKGRQDYQEDYPYEPLPNQIRPDEDGGNLRDGLHTKDKPEWWNKAVSSKTESMRYEWDYCDGKNTPGKLTVKKGNWAP